MYEIDYTCIVERSVLRGNQLDCLLGCETTQQRGGSR